MIYTIMLPIVIGESELCLMAHKIINNLTTILLSILLSLSSWDTIQMPSNSPPTFAIATWEWATAKLTPIRCPQLVPANAFNAVFLLATSMQCVLNEKNISKYTPSNFGLRTRGSSESSVLIFGWVLACTGSGVNRVTE